MTLRSDFGSTLTLLFAERRSCEYADVPVHAGVIGVEAAGLGVVGGEGDREQPLLTAEGDPAGDVEEGPLQYPALADHLDRTALLNHEQELPVRLTRGRGRVDRGVEVPQIGQLDSARLSERKCGWSGPRARRGGD